MSTKYTVLTVPLDVVSAIPGVSLIPRGTHFRSVMLLELDGATDFHLTIGADQNPIPFTVPGFLFENDDPCDDESDGLYGTWLAAPGGVAKVLVVYGGGQFSQRVA